MSKTTTKPRRKAAPAFAPLPPAKKTNLELSGNALAALARLKQQHGMSRTFAIERGVLLLEQKINSQTT